MAIIKAVNSRASIGHAINYITKKEKTDVRLIGGYNCTPSFILDEMKATKKAWDKIDGRQCKHFIQSFPKDENITLAEANQIAKELIESWSKFQGYEVCYATHKDREHIHTHIIVNSVSFETGWKFNYSKKELQDMKDLSDQILVNHQKRICVKNDEITSFDMNSYRPIEKAAQGTYTSWMLKIMMAVTKALSEAQSKEMFSKALLDSDIQVDWQKNKKYVVFTDKNGNKVRDKRLAKIFKINLGNEDMLNEFRRNYEQQRGKGTDINESGKTGNRRENELRFDNDGKCCTERAVGEIRSRFDEVSDIDKRYNVSERAKELKLQHRDAEELARKNEPVGDKQSGDKRDNTSRDRTIYRRNGISC